MTTIATATLPKNVQYPQYDRSQLRSRIVHFGFGAFHRAHQALLTDPQTSGGLLAAVAPEAVDDVLARFHAAGFGYACEIGSLTAGDAEIIVR